MCGGVVCKEDYKFNGKQYCLARWGIDKTATDAVSHSSTAPARNRRWVAVPWTTISEALVRRRLPRPKGRRHRLLVHEAERHGCGCPMLAASGCIEPPPVAGQCAIFKEDVESVCGGDPMCGGVVCRHTYEFMGKLYCLARWGIDEDAIDSGPSNERRYAFRRREAVRNYQGGTTFSTYRTSCGCPQLLNGCIEPPPVAGQCAIYENDVVSVCGGDPSAAALCGRRTTSTTASSTASRAGASTTRRVRAVYTMSARRGVRGSAAGRTSATFSTPYQCGARRRPTPRAGRRSCAVGSHARLALDGGPTARLPLLRRKRRGGQRQFQLECLRS